MIKHVHDIIPPLMVDELLRLGKLDRYWLEWRQNPDNPKAYIGHWKRNTWLGDVCKNGADGFSMLGASVWLQDGPKLFRPSPEQCDVLEQIEVNLPLTDYAQPYEAFLIDLPEGKYHPFMAVLCHHSPWMLTMTLNSVFHLEDITTTVSSDNEAVEVALNRYDEDCARFSKVAARIQRIAVNACLALVNYGHHKDYLYPHDARRDHYFAREDSERGRRARARLANSTLEVVSFSQEVTLYHTESCSHEPGEPTGREVRSHWRRGHWAMQAYGPHSSLRKRILRKPVLVRSDKFLGDHSDTQVIYRP